MKRPCNAKIVATLGPASADRATIEALVHAGADVFRLNFSHGTHADHKQRLDLIRSIESDIGRPIGVLLDLQGPKLRVGTFANGPVKLVEGAPFRLDLDRNTPGDATRAPLPHPEIFAALEPGAELLLDDGRLRLTVEKSGPDLADTRVVNGGMLSDRKGVNVPGVVLPLSAMTDKDRADLDFGLTLGVDWIALSFVQRAADIVEAKAIVRGRAGIVAKLEKPAAIECLDEILAVTDAVMVARGDLGVEMPAEQVPAIQKRIVRACRKRGSPVIVARMKPPRSAFGASPQGATPADRRSRIRGVCLVAPFHASRVPLRRHGAMTPRLETARRLALVWGVNSVVCNDVANVDDMTERAVETAAKLQFAQPGQTIVIAAGMPFGTPGSTNLLRIAQLN